MTDIDELGSLLLEQSKRFLEKAKEAEENDAASAFLHAALNLGFCAFEAHINSIAQDQLERTDLSVHEKAILAEKKVELCNGAYELQKGLQMYRLEDRLQFLWTRFSVDAPFDRDSPVWASFKEGLELRNGLTHPKDRVNITTQKVERTLLAMIELIDIAYKRIYKKGFPLFGQGLHSALNF